MKKGWIPVHFERFELSEGIFHEHPEKAIVFSVFEYFSVPEFLFKLWSPAGVIF